MSSKHVPVLLNEVLTSFEPVTGFIVDCTLGRGGHFFALLKKHNNLVGLDADLESINHIENNLLKLGFSKQKDSSFTYKEKKIYLVHTNFVNLTDVLVRLKLKRIGGVLVDLGISMHQLKDSKRGFSFANLNEPLDMRIDTSSSVKASDLVNNLSYKQLAALLKILGQVREHETIAKNIVDFRQYKKVTTVRDLLKAARLVKRNDQKRHPATKVFMALRIATNSEFINLNKFLDSNLQLLKNETLFNIITFHSLEEKIVKTFLLKNNINFNLISPSDFEISKNVSARSAKLFEIKNDG